MSEPALGEYERLAPQDPMHGRKEADLEIVGRRLRRSDWEGRRGLKSMYDCGIGNNKEIRCCWSGKMWTDKCQSDSTRSQWCGKASSH